MSLSNTRDLNRQEQVWDRPAMTACKPAMWTKPVAATTIGSRHLAVTTGSHARFTELVAIRSNRLRLHPSKITTHLPWTLTHSIKLLGNKYVHIYQRALFEVDRKIASPTLLLMQLRTFRVYWYSTYLCTTPQMIFLKYDCSTAIYPPSSLAIIITNT